MGEAAIGEEVGVSEVGVRACSHIIGRRILGREGEQSEVVEEHILGHAKRSADGRPVVWSPVDPKAWIEVLVLRLRSAEGNEAGNTCSNVQVLCALADWNRRELVPETVVECDGRRDAPGVVYVTIESGLVAIVDEVSGRALAKVRWSQVVEILREVVILIVATNTLGKGLGRDELAPIKADFELMFALGPADVVYKLVEILNS